MRKIVPVAAALFATIVASSGVGGTTGCSALGAGDDGGTSSGGGDDGSASSSGGEGGGDDGTASSSGGTDATTSSSGGEGGGDDGTASSSGGGDASSEGSSGGSDGNGGDGPADGGTGDGPTEGSAGDSGTVGPWSTATVPPPNVSTTLSISGIWFKSPTSGAVQVLPGGGYVSEPGFPGGSEVYGVTGPTTISASPIFSGDKVAGTGGVNVEFGGFAAGPFGLAALTDEALFVNSPSQTSLSFTATPSKIATIGNEQLVFLAEAPANHWVAVDYAGYFYTGTSSAAGTLPTSWTANHSALLCGNNLSAATWATGSTPPGSSAIYMSPDGHTLVWSAGIQSGVCVSNDGGQTAQLVDFPNVPADSYQGGVPTIPPQRIAFADSLHGIAVSVGAGFFTPYVYTTSNGGSSWKPGALPFSALIPGKSYAISDAFFSQDGKQAYIIGSLDASPPAQLLWVSADSGVTWHDVSSTLAQFPSGDYSFTTGFALDANDVWLGGTDNANGAGAAILAYAHSGVQPVCGACTKNSDCTGGSCNTGVCNLPAGTTCSADMCNPTACNSGNTACLCAIANPPVSGWSATAVPYNDGVNFVDGIYFSSLSQGVLAIAGAEGSPPSLGGPGAIMAMTSPVTTDVVLLDGTGQGPAGNNLTFGGFVQTNGSLVALTDTRSLVASANGGQTWTNTPTGLYPGSGDIQAWIEHDTSGRWTVLLGSGGGMYQATGTLSANTTWNRVGGTIFNGASFQWPYGRFYENPNGNNMFFTYGTVYGVETSSNAGASWSLKALPNLPTDGSATGPFVLQFHDANDGVVALPGTSSANSPAPQVWITTNGGTTWTNATLPAKATQVHASFSNAFYTPDGTNLWLIGTQSNGTSILYHASGLPSASVTFTDQSASLNAFAGSQAGAFTVGYAYDATDIWLGGAAGYLVYSNTGGN